MKKLNQSGFTLIEMIVVLIIIGILAAIALPNLFANIQKSKGAQAISTLDSYKTPVESCMTSNATLVMANGGGSAPCTLALLNLDSALNNWTYYLPAGHAQSANIGTAGAGGGTYLTNDLTYALGAFDAGAPANEIDLSRGSDGSWTCSTGTNNPYTGIC